MSDASSKSSGRMPAMTSPPACKPWGRSISPNGRRTLPPSTCAVKKFIDGDPMKPATKMLRGLL